ncbi:hypothetical protein DMA15_15750 [Streptomyces sp. WAC 01529]|uniref:hypothetical protein n=1 Tax=Streptomyces sp. WAC 01529 TaxID=2203205 RepID=UPI000F6D1419|nr:hypothetical protein [Streptomyces sp. WAC 01529]AZM57703.1 hypothetical protein DMA15_15750 [Streptomyces sp. WAC 01529]
MANSPYRGSRTASSALLVGLCVLPLAGCGDQHGRTATGTGARTPASTATPETSTTAPQTSAPASPYVEPGVVDGAPHHGENNAHRRPGGLTSADKKAAQAEAARIEPVLKRLWRQKKWDPDSVRTALTDRLGYEVRETSGKGELLGGELDVREMYERYESGDDVTPEGALIGLYVGEDACVTAFVQESNYEVRANGRFMETGCIEPPTGH